MRQIDPKYHIENEQIIKTTNGVSIPLEEPLILFRGRDRLARKMLYKYFELCAEDGCTSYQLEGIQNRIKAFEDFYQENLEIMKQPGCTLGK